MTTLLTSYGLYATGIVFPEEYNGLPVRYIKENAFAGKSFIFSVTIPASMKEIGDEAFFSCSALTEVNFAPEGSIEGIGARAFGY